MSRMEVLQQHGGGVGVGKLDSPRAVLAGPSWTDLACALEDLKECQSPSLGMDGEEAGDWLRDDPMDAMLPSLPFPEPMLEDASSGELCAQLGSSGSPSAGESSGEAPADPALSCLLDGNMRAMFKKVMVNEATLNQAVERLGGGDRGLKSLLGYIMLWFKERNATDCSMAQCMEQLRPKLPTGDFSPAAGYNSSFPALYDGGPGHVCDRYNGVSRLKRPFSAEMVHQGPDELQHHRFKSRRVSTGVDADSVGAFTARNLLNAGAGGVCHQYSSQIELSALNSLAHNSSMNCEEGRRHQLSCLQPGLGCGLGGAKVSPAATTRAARKSRMARQRQSMAHHHGRSTPHGGVGCGGWTVLPSGGDLKNMSPCNSQMQPATKGQGRTLDTLLFLLQKELRPSDVGNLGRIVLPKKEAENHLPYLAMREGLSIAMEDFDTSRVWNFRYRFWPNNKSRMYLLEDTGEFVKMHHLEEGDLLILYRDFQGNYVLRGKKNVQLDVASTGAGTVPTDSQTGTGRVIQEGSVKMEEVQEEGFQVCAPGVEVCRKVELEEAGEDPFLKDVMQGLEDETSFGGVGLQPLERFPSLESGDVSIDEILGLADVGLVATTVPKGEPVS